MNVIEPYYSQDGIVIYNADCRKVLPFLDRFDLLLTDPPYGIGADKGASIGGTDSTGRYIRRPKRYEGGWDGSKPSDALLLTAVDSAESCIVWGGNYMAGVLPEGGRWLFWDKLNSMPSYSDGEIAWTNINGVAVKKFTQCNNGLASLRDGCRVHPTQKPVNLMRWCLSLVPDAQTVLDPFMGSGTTLVAAKMEGKTAVGIEINEAYCEAAVKRLSQQVFDFT